MDEQTEHGQLTLVSSADCAAPVTAVAPLEGNVMASIGTRIFVYSLNDAKQELVPCAFKDCKIYTVSIRTIKNFVLVDRHT